MIDLHVHSTFSDGTLTPTQLVEHAMENHLTAFALTDHDTVDGLGEAFQAAEDKPIKVISGIEFSTEYNSQDIHIVGLDFDWHDTSFCQKLDHFRNARFERNRKMAEKLADCGFPITIEALQEMFGDAVLTRAHFARFLYEKGCIPSMNDAFFHYIGNDGPCFVPREKVTPAMAVHLIHKLDGIAVLAHPMQYHLSDSQLKELIRTLKPEGLNGIEAMYSRHSVSQENRVRRLAQVMGLAVSGGSDFHGNNIPGIDLGVGRGNLRIPDTTFENLRKHRDRQY